MNPIPFFRAPDKDPEFFACGKCGQVHDIAEVAEKCCRPNICECGAECRLYWLSCDQCLDRKRAERDKAARDKAPRIKLADYDGPVYDEHMDKYFENADLWLEECEMDDVEPVYGWTCDVRTASLDIMGAIENALDDVEYEDAYFDNEDELIDFVNEWNNRQSCQYWMQAGKIIEGPPKEIGYGFSESHIDDAEELRIHDGPVHIFSEHGGHFATCLPCGATWSLNWVHTESGRVVDLDEASCGDGTCPSKPA